jgi:hypothetical protein
LRYRAGQTVLLRARVTEDCTDASKSSLVPVVVEDFPLGNYVSRAFAPFSEVADFADADRLKRPATVDPRWSPVDPDWSTRR